MKIIFDVGSYDGSDYLAECRANPNTHVYAFEPQPLMVEEIMEKAKDVPNFHLFPYAVADYDGQANFYLSGGGKGGLSSLKYYTPSEVWGNKRFDHWVETRVVKLKTFIEEHNIPYIDYLHVDAQGADLLILKGLEEHHQIVKAGDIEAQLYPLYQGAHTKEEAEGWMASNGWDFYSRSSYPDREVTIFFENKAFIAR